jgi:hypothetical protein
VLPCCRSFPSTAVGLHWLPTVLHYPAWTFFRHKQQRVDNTKEKLDNLQQYLVRMLSLTLISVLTIDGRDGAVTEAVEMEFDQIRRNIISVVDLFLRTCYICCLVSDFLNNMGSFNIPSLQLCCHYCVALI